MKRTVGTSYGQIPGMVSLSLFKKYASIVGPRGSL
jgi:hypothetical protein